MYIARHIPHTIKAFKTYYSADHVLDKTSNFLKTDRKARRHNFFLIYAKPRPRPAKTLLFRFPVRLSLSTS